MKAATVYLLHLLTDAARSWVEEHVSVETWQWFGVGNALAVEHGYIGELVNGMAADGLEYDEDFSVSA